MTEWDARSVCNLTDGELLAAVGRAAGDERAATCRLLDLLAELDARRLYLGEGFSSLFTYCTGALRMSEHAAYGRIEAARCAAKFPRVRALLAEGALTLTTVGMLSSRLALDNADALLDAASGRSKREVERLIAAVRPLPAIASQVRRLPARDDTAERANIPLGHVQPGTCSESSREATPIALSASNSALSLGSAASDRCPRASGDRPRTALSHARVTPLAPERYKVQFTASHGVHDLLQRAQELLRHVIPSGDIALIIERALTMLVKDLERMRVAAETRPRGGRSCDPTSRHVPAAVSRAVWERDGSQCAFVGARGRCSERGFLEIHHVLPYAAGGPTVLDNLQLRCRAHNLHEAERYFGSRATGRPGPGRIRDGPESGSDSVLEPV